MKRRFLALFLTAALACSIAACGKDGGSEPAGDSPQTEESAELTAEEESAEPAVEEEPEVDPMTAALENMNSVTSMETKMVTEAKMVISADGQEQSRGSITVMDMALFSDPMKIKMEMTMETEGENVEMSIYGEAEEDGTYMMYVYDGMNWQSQPVGVADLESFSARDSMASSIGDGSLYKAEGMEQIDGANAYKYSYVMTGDEMKEAMFSYGVGFARELGIDLNQLDSMLDGLGEITTYVWIDEATLYPVKYEMDMTEAMDALIVNMVEEMGELAAGKSINVPKAEIIMTCSNFNNVADFSVPDEAKAN